MADHFSPQQNDVSPQVLPQIVERFIKTLREKFNKPPLEPYTRLLLCSIGEEKSTNILREISRRYGEIGSLDVLIIQSAHKFTPNASTPPTTSRFSHHVADITPTRLMNSPAFESTPVQSPVQMKVENGCGGSSSNGITSPLIALGELEFRKAFLILNYIGHGGTRLEEAVSAEQIRRWKDLPMSAFESQIWQNIGFRYIKDGERRKSVDWDTGAAHIYHCHVSPDGTYLFKGPFLANERNFLQRTLGDDNVLMVKFAEEADQNSSFNTSTGCPYQFYEKFLKEGILVGLRRYRFFVFKDGGKEEKKKEPTASCVKCFFVRMESAAYSDSPDYILNGKTIRQARSIFMHLDTLKKGLSNYMARFSLILSKTLNLEIDLSCIEVEEISDIKGQDEHGQLVENSILTDGTGFISEDLAVKCPKSLFKGSKKAHNIEKSESHLNEPPLLIQFRLFNKGSAVKGTLLINKKLPPKTIQVRPSMIKVQRNPNLYNIPTSNSLEVVNTSNRPKQGNLSKTLILLLSYGGVPHEFFMYSLCCALEGAKGALVSKRTALRVALNNSLDDYHVAKMMILAGIPLEESFLHSRLAFLMKEEKKGLKAGKIPVAESYYLMGTTDPTGLLEEGEVCIILDNGHISGKVLVYRNPGLHFGDIHILNARYVDSLKDYVGNAKYAIFFPIKGKRSTADEIAGGDYDGDMYFVSRNPQLLEKFAEGERWVSSSPVTNNIPKKKPAEFSDEELEEELFKVFLETRFNSSNIVGIAADSWTAMMDRFVTLGPDSAEEKMHMKDNMCRLIDIYYDALDAPKSGKMVGLPNHLKAELFPHYMERNEHMSYRSTSIMGLIYDKVKSEEEDPPEKEVWKLPFFSDPPQHCLDKWRKLYKDYRKEMGSACEIENKDLKNRECESVIKRYKEFLYEAAEFEESRRNRNDIYDEACALYNIVYDYAIGQRKLDLCGFAWKVAGKALCSYYIGLQKEEPMMCSISALKEILN